MTEWCAYTCPLSRRKFTTCARETGVAGVRATASPTYGFRWLVKLVQLERNNHWYRKKTTQIRWSLQREMWSAFHRPMILSVLQSHFSRCRARKLSLKPANHLSAAANFFAVLRACEIAEPRGYQERFVATELTCKNVADSWKGVEHHATDDDIDRHVIRHAVFGCCNRQVSMPTSRDDLSASLAANNTRLLNDVACTSALCLSTDASIVLPYKTHIFPLDLTDLQRNKSSFDISKTSRK